MEVRFIWCCLKTFEQEPPLMTFSTSQMEGLRHLNQCLQMKQPSYSQKGTASAMYTAYYSLYFPDDNTDLAVNSFNSPLTVFLAFLWLCPQGGYESIWSIPPKLAKVQFSMRLRGARHLKQTLDNCLSDKRDRKEQKPWFE